MLKVASVQIKEKRTGKEAELIRSHAITYTITVFLRVETYLTKAIKNAMVFFF